MRIDAIAAALPSCQPSNDELIESLLVRSRDALSAAQIAKARVFLGDRLRRTGAVGRFHRTSSETAMSLGLTAGRQALSEAGLAPGDIDLLVYVGVGRGFIEPATAHVFQHALGLVNATCFDLLDACASWLRALDVARRFLAAGVYRHVLLLNSECNVREYTPRQLTASDDLEALWSGLTIGEAATATILSANAVSGDAAAGPGGDDAYHATFRSAGAYAMDCQIALPGASDYRLDDDDRDVRPFSFHARPRALAQAAARQLHRQFFGDARFANASFDRVFGHTVSVPLSQLMLRRLKLDTRRHVEIFPSHGNVVSASLPLAMQIAARDGRLRRGDRILLTMGGAGMTTGLCSLTY